MPLENIYNIVSSRSKLTLTEYLKGSFKVPRKVERIVRSELDHLYRSLSILHYQISQFICSSNSEFDKLISRVYSGENCSYRIYDKANLAVRSFP